MSTTVPPLHFLHLVLHAQRQHHPHPHLRNIISISLYPPILSPIPMVQQADRKDLEVDNNTSEERASMFSNSTFAGLGCGWWRGLQSLTWMAWCTFVRWDATVRQGMDKMELSYFFQRDIDRWSCKFIIITFSFFFFGSTIAGKCVLNVRSNIHKNQNLIKCS